MTGAAGADSPIRFRDVTAETGIDFVHTHGGSGRKYIVETSAAGLATFDYDNDGKIDIYFLNGRPLAGTKAKAPPKNHLYRNLGGFRFKDVTDEAGVGGGGVRAGRMRRRLRQRRLPGPLREQLRREHPLPQQRRRNVHRRHPQGGSGRGHKVGAGACFLDYDNDGHLDLYAANYVKFSEENPSSDHPRHSPSIPGPKDYPPETHNLFHNNGDGTFTDVSRSRGSPPMPATGMEMICGRYDNDGYPDIFVANDVSPELPLPQRPATASSRRSPCRPASPATSTAATRTWEWTARTTTTAACSVST